jgi:hypothetical protein
MEVGTEEPSARSIRSLELGGPPDAGEDGMSPSADADDSMEPVGAADEAAADEASTANWPSSRSMEEPVSAAEEPSVRSMLEESIGAAEEPSARFIEPDPVGPAEEASERSLLEQPVRHRVARSPPPEREGMSGGLREESLTREAHGFLADDGADDLEAAPVTAKELVQMIAESGDTIPPSDINEFADYVAELTGEKVPGTLKQKRAFIANWYAEQAPPIGAHTPRERAPAHTPRERAPTPPPENAYDKAEVPDRETLLRDIAQHGAQARARAPRAQPALRAPA